MAGRGLPVAGALRHQLYLWLFVATVGVALLAGGVTFGIAFHEANQLQDKVLSQVASFIDRRDLAVASPATTRSEAHIAIEDRVLIRRLGTKSSVKHAPPPHFSAELGDGLHVVTAAHNTYRVLVKTLADGERVAVAQQTAVRNETAIQAALVAILPSLVGLPILLLIVGLRVRRLLSPVTRIANALDRRGEADLSRIRGPELPAEIQPFVEAINRLLDRVAQLIATRHRFIDAAAHELRTPLAALSVQAERLQTHIDAPADRRRLLRELRQGINRNQRVVDQLLSLARTRVPSDAPAEPCSVNAAVRDVVSALLPLADAKQIELITRAPHSVTAQVMRHELDTVLNNLIGNAIQYTPNGGTIAITLDRQHRRGFIEVEDSGPGLSNSEKVRVNAPFYRAPGAETPGAGLGLAIVYSITERWHGELILSDAKRFATGLVARVTFAASN